MAVYTMELTDEYSYPHIVLYKMLRDGVQYGWQIYPEEGYVMYDTTDETYEIDPETGEEIPVTYYFVDVSLPMNYPMNNMTWVAVPRDSVDENYIFGLPNEEHEKI